jgi:hypothetical protein
MWVSGHMRFSCHIVIPFYEWQSSKIYFFIMKMGILHLGKVHSIMLDLPRKLESQAQGFEYCSVIRAGEISLFMLPKTLSTICL